MRVIDLLDWAGTLVFAVSGGIVGVQKRFDLFGVLFLAFVVAVAGGVLRDVLIGAVPPVAIAHPHYLMLSMLGGLLSFYGYREVMQMQRLIALVDALGLALFAVVGAQKALSYGIPPVTAAVLGMISGIGGGMIRDVLAGEVPVVLRADLYALAALAAGAVVSLGQVLGLPPAGPMFLGIVVCVFLRLMAMFRGWRAPVARG